MVPNKSFIYKKLPTGVPIQGEHLAIEERPIDLNYPPPGGCIVRIVYSSFDPYQRGRMRDPAVYHYLPAYDINEPVWNDCIACVVTADATCAFREGDIVISFLPVAEYAHVPADFPLIRGIPGIRKLENPHNIDLAHFLGAAGMPGLTAYSGFYHVGKPKRGETIFVSSAAGAVGQVVGQLAKREGLRVIGSVGSDEKLDMIVNELGFDAGFNYKKESPHDALARLAPSGIDIYFESVGGEHLEAALDHMNPLGRIPVCGMIEGYNKPKSERFGIKGLLHLTEKQIRMEGFLVTNPDLGVSYYKDHQENVAKWIAEGSFKSKVDITGGIDKACEGFLGMLAGRNFGKAMLSIK